MHAFLVAPQKGVVVISACQNRFPDNMAEGLIPKAKLLSSPGRVPISWIFFPWSQTTA